MDRTLRAVLLSLVVVGLAVLFLGRGKPPTKESLLRDIEAPQVLTDALKSLKEPQIIKVTDGVYVAVNYAFANSILLEGPQGAVIVDTTENSQAAVDIAARFKEITDKPLQAIIYTHHHTDHTAGTRAFIEDPENPPMVIAHRLFPEELRKIQTTGAIHLKRAMFQFGYHLDRHMMAGQGRKIKFDLKNLQAVQPNTLVEEKETAMEIGGIKLTILHLPGETNDHLGVWLPEKKVFLAADNIYKAFPNLYAIRGTVPRDVTEWIASLEEILELEPEHLIGSHTSPVSGKDKVHDVLYHYRSAIQYVHDQTVRWINQGLHPEEIANIVQLPPELAEHPHLQQLYGNVPWSVKGIFSGYLGWFSGHIQDLDPVTPKERAARMIELVGRKQLLKSAKQALDSGDAKWALELSSHVFVADPDNRKAIEIRKEAMRALAAIQTSMNGRQYYLSWIVGDAGLLNEIDVRMLVERMSLRQTLNVLRYRVKGESTQGINTKTCLEFEDSKETYCLHLHHGILDILEGPAEDWNGKLTLTSRVWKDILMGALSPAKAYLTGAIQVEGGLNNLRTFFGYFDRTE